MEALLALLNFVHSGTNNIDSSEIICQPKCPSHLAFGLVVEEKIKCICKAERLSRWNFSTFFHPFYVNEIFEDLSDIDPSGLLFLSENEELASIELSSIMKCESRLSEYVKKQWEHSEILTCPRDCKFSKSKKTLRLLSSPKVFVINMIWKDFRPDPLKILQVYASIPYSISLDSIYNYESTTVHVLKSVIYYGAGHYLAAIRGSVNKNWFKIDDEHSKIIGSWKDFIQDSLKMRFYPVGLFYEESTERDSHNVSPKDWITLEKQILESQNSQENKDQWTCECQEINSFEWKLCKKCGKIKAGIKGWVCKKCTFVNENNHYNCESCDGTNEEEKKNFENLRKKICKICGQENEILCKKCFFVDKCWSCKEFIQRKEGLLCFRCKGLLDDTKKCRVCVRSLNEFVCKKCTFSLWRCEICKLFNFPDKEDCVTSECLGKKVFSPSFETKKLENPQKTEEKYQSSMKNIETTKLHENCVACGNFLKPQKYFCVNCEIKINDRFCRFCNTKVFDFLCEECGHFTKNCGRCKKKFFIGRIDCPSCLVKY